MRLSKLTAAIALGVSAIGLSACASTFPAQVSRYQAMPAPAGQSFYVIPMDASMQGGLEFGRNADYVAAAMRAQGYDQAPTVQAATMVVKVGYGVDQGRQVIDQDPFYRGGYGGGGFGYGGGLIGSYGRFYDPFYASYYGRPYYSPFGYYGLRSPFYYGWDSPYYGGGATSYVEYQSFLDIDIRRKADNADLFEGHAKARSTSDNLGTLVPNLVTAMFTGFPGRSGETVRISVPQAPRR